MTSQVTLRELLRDPQYRAWFMKVPNLNVHHTQPPWRFYGQKEEGKGWARKDFATYAGAYTAVKARLSDYFDMTIHCKPQGFKPPAVKLDGVASYLPCPEGHGWCIYCRRPTIFACFSKHPAIKHVVADYEPRCLICGARSAGMRHYRPKFTWSAYRESE